MKIKKRVPQGMFVGLVVCLSLGCSAKNPGDSGDSEQDSDRESDSSDDEEPETDHEADGKDTYTNSSSSDGDSDGDGDEDSDGDGDGAGDGDSDGDRDTESDSSVESDSDTGDDPSGTGTNSGGTTDDSEPPGTDSEEATDATDLPDTEADLAVSVFWDRDSDAIAADVADMFGTVCSFDGTVPIDYFSPTVLEPWIEEGREYLCLDGAFIRVWRDTTGQIVNAQFSDPNEISSETYDYPQDTARDHSREVLEEIGFPFDGTEDLQEYGGGVAVYNKMYEFLAHQSLRGELLAIPGHYFKYNGTTGKCALCVMGRPLPNIDKTPGILTPDELQALATEYYLSEGYITSPDEVGWTMENENVQRYAIAGKIIITVGSVRVPVPGLDDHDLYLVMDMVTGEVYDQFSVYDE
jgi:hypothetical protein